MACAPAMTFHIGKSDRPTRFLLRGDSEGQIVMWTLPEVTERQMTLVRQESFDRLPGHFAYLYILVHLYNHCWQILYLDITHFWFQGSFCSCSTLSWLNFLENFVLLFYKLKLFSHRVEYSDDGQSSVSKFLIFSVSQKPQR